MLFYHLLRKGYFKVLTKLTNCAPKNDGNIVLAEIEKCGPNAFEWNDEPGKNCAPG